MTTYKTGTKRGLRFWSAELDKPKTTSERAEVMEMLRQLEIHSPTWIKKIRAYIRKLERK